MRSNHVNGELISCSVGSMTGVGGLPSGVILIPHAKSYKMYHVTSAGK